MNRTHATAAPLVGTLTIGQAPRADVTPILEAHLPRGTWCVHAGVLDDLSPREIEEQFGYRAGGRLLVTRLTDGTVVDLDGDRIEVAVRDGLAQLEARGCGVIVLLCTGTFHGLSCERAWLVEPDRVIAPVVSAMLGARRLGVVVPAEPQIASEAGKWSSLAVRPVFAVASPYADDVRALREAVVALRGEGADAIVLDCIGFTERHRLVATDAAGLPVLLSNAIVARVAGELVASCSGK
jgi:protein AroM